MFWVPLGDIPSVRYAAAHEGLASGARVFQVVVMLAVAKSQLEDLRVSTGGVLAAIVLAEYATYHLVRIGMVFITTVLLVTVYSLFVIKFQRNSTARISSA